MRREFEAVSTHAPGVRLWAGSSAEALAAYVKVFRPRPPGNVLVRPLEAPELAEAYTLTEQGPRRLGPGRPPA